MKNIEKEFKEFFGELEKVKKEIAERDFRDSLNGADEIIEKKQYFPVDIYLDTDDTKMLERVNNSVKDFLRSIDAEIFTKAEIFKGSIIEKFWVGTKSVISHIDLLKKLFEAVKGMLPKKEVEFKKISNNVEYSSAKLANTVKMLKDVPNISIRIGSMLLTKATIKNIPVIQVKNLSKEEMILLERNPNLLRSPKLIHNRLKKLKMDNIIAKSGYLAM